MVLLKLFINSISSILEITVSKNYIIVSGHTSHLENKHLAIDRFKSLSFFNIGMFKSTYFVTNLGKINNITIHMLGSRKR